MPKKFNAKKSGEAALFNGKTPEELRVMLGIPTDFRVEAFLGVPIEQVPQSYLRVMLDGAIFEARLMRKKIEDAISYGDSNGMKTDETEETKEETPQ